jgi:hypothetical protein
MLCFDLPACNDEILSCYLKSGSWNNIHVSFNPAPLLNWKLCYPAWHWLVSSLWIRFEKNAWMCIILYSCIPYIASSCITHLSHALHQSTDLHKITTISDNLFQSFLKFSLLQLLCHVPYSHRPYTIFQHIVFRDMVWKLSKLQSGYNELGFYVELDLTPCTSFVLGLLIFK